MNVLKTLEMVNEFKESTNSAIYKMWMHAVSLNKSGVWQKPEYYKGADELAYLANVPFSNFFKEVFGYSILWYNRMWQIKKLKNGNELFYKHGYTNMVTYVKSTEKERETIIAEAEKSLKTVSFSSIKYRLFPKQHKEPAADKAFHENVKAMAQENEKLKQQLSETRARHKAEVESYVSEIKKLQNTVAYLQSIRQHLRTKTRLRRQQAANNHRNFKPSTSQ